MSLLDNESLECMKSELELFTTPPTQTSIEKSGYVNIYPLTSLQLNGPLEFVLTPSSDNYIDLQKTILYLKCRLMFKGDTEITKKAPGEIGYDKTRVALVCYFHASQFKGLELF